MGRKATIVAAICMLLLGGCSTGEEDFAAEVLSKKPSERSVSATLDAVTSNEQLKKFVEESVEQIRVVWGEYSHGHGSFSPTIEYVEGTELKQTLCRDKNYAQVYSALFRPVACNDVLYVPMTGMRVLWQDAGMRETPGDNEAVMYLALATSLHDYYHATLAQYAKTEFNAYLPITIDDTRKQLFAHCIAGVLAAGAFPGRSARLFAKWDLGYQLAIRRGYERTPADCYWVYWANK